MEFEEAEAIRPRPSLSRNLSAQFSRASAIIRRQTSLAPVSSAKRSSLVTETSIPKSKSVSELSGSALSTGQQPSVASTSSDVGGHRFKVSPSVPIVVEPEVRPAGDMAVYSSIKVISFILAFPYGVNIPIQDAAIWECKMIRERVATNGLIRPLECEEELDAIQMPSERIGRFSEATMHRYKKERAIFDKKFAHATKSVEKQRRHNLERAKHDTIKRLGILKQSLQKSGKASEGQHGTGSKGKVVKENVIASPGWGWAWALDEGEDPPPSSIVSRRDTEEARKLAEVADQAVLSDDQTFSANNLWSVVINFLTVTPGKSKHTLYKSSQHESSEGIPSEANSSASVSKLNSPERKGSKLTTMWKRSKSLKGSHKSSD